jgi:hypothetical protein
MTEIGTRQEELLAIAEQIRNKAREEGYTNLAALSLPDLIEAIRAAYARNVPHNIPRDTRH